MGLDGAGDVSKGLGKISGSLKDLFSMGIQTKLTLAGIAAGLTGAAFSAGKTGKNLLEFKYAFDLSTRELQKFSWATRQFGVDNEEAIGYIQRLQDALADARQGGGYAKTFTSLLIDPSKMKDAFDVAKAIQERAKGANVDYYRTMGDLMSQSMVAANRRMAEKGGLGFWMGRAPKDLIKTDSQIEQQAKIALAFDNFSQNLKNTMENFIAKNEPLITKLIAALEKLFERLLNFVGDVSEDATGSFTKDVLKGDSIPLAVTNAAGRGVLSYGDTINEAVVEGGKALWDSLKSGAMEIEAQKMLNEAKTKPKVDNSQGFVEIQKGNTSIFYIGNIDATDALSKNAKDEFTRLATHKIISQGAR